jgi:hypothetical protein
MEQTIELTRDQVSEMNHALGLNYKKKPTRNYYYCEGCRPSWSQLVDNGYATRSTGWSEGKTYFRLKYEGAKLVFKKQMSRKYFNNLP